MFFGGTKEEKTKISAEPKNFYFLAKQTHQSAGTGDEGAVETEVSGRDEGGVVLDDGSSSSWFGAISRFFGRSDHAYQNIAAKPRKVPTKVEPKVFFANERTFLSWMHMAVTLSSISVAIVAFADTNEMSEVYGLMLMPVAIAFCAYACYQYMRRATMIRRREPGPCKIY
jgi:uncharacterized membrane protein YidH (DUF202 family)